MKKHSSSFPFGAVILAGLIPPRYGDIFRVVSAAGFRFTAGLCQMIW